MQKLTYEQRKEASVQIAREFPMSSRCRLELKQFVTGNENGGRAHDATDSMLVLQEGLKKKKRAQLKIRQNSVKRRKIDPSLELTDFVVDRD
jgi:hypothetical protein